MLLSDEDHKLFKTRMHFHIIFSSLLSSNVFCVILTIIFYDDYHMIMLIMIVTFDESFFIAHSFQLLDGFENFQAAYRCWLK